MNVEGPRKIIFQLQSQHYGNNNIIVPDYQAWWRSGKTQQPLLIGTQVNGFRKLETYPLFMDVTVA
jgi:hypothetical protein